MIPDREILRSLGELNQSLDIPMIAGGDFNFQPACLKAAQFVERIGASTIVPAQATCRSRGARGTYAYFIGRRRFPGLLSEVWAAHEASTHPHYPTRLTFHELREGVRCVAYARAAPNDTVRAIGPLAEPKLGGGGARGRARHGGGQGGRLAHRRWCDGWALADVRWRCRARTHNRSGVDLPARRSAVQTGVSKAGVTAGSPCSSPCHWWVRPPSPLTGRGWPPGPETCCLKGSRARASCDRLARSRPLT